MSTYQVHDPHWIVATDRMNDLLQEAERARLVRQARPTRQARLNGPGLWERALAGIGSLLVSVGERLQARYEPTAYTSAEVCCAEY